MSIYNLKSLERFFKPEQIAKKHLESGEVLFHEGDKSESVFFVLEGEIRAETYLENGKSIVFFRAYEGAALAEESLFLNHYIYTAVCTVASTVRSLHKTDFLDKFRNEPAFNEALFSCIAERYSEALNVREILAIKSADERVLRWLQWRAQLGSNTFDLSGNIGMIAPELNLTRESVYRAIAKLAKSGRIEKNGGVITVIDQNVRRMDRDYI